MRIMHNSPNRGVNYHIFQNKGNYPVILIYACPLSSASIIPVITQDAVQFSGAVFIGSGRARTVCFMGRRVTPLPVVPSPRPWKRAGMKASLNACSTGPKASPMSGVNLCTNDHSCWSDFFSPT